MTNIRKQVLKVFKQLHRTNCEVFKGNDELIAQGRKYINHEFRKNIGIRDKGIIKEMVNLARCMEEEVRLNMRPYIKLPDEQRGKLPADLKMSKAVIKTLTCHTYALPEPELEPYSESNVFPSAEDMAIEKKSKRDD